MLVLLSGDDARLIKRGGWTTKDSIKKYLAEHVCVDKEAYLKYFSRGRTRILEKYPGPICPWQPENFDILRVGDYPGKSAFY